MEGSGDDVILLFWRQFNKIDGITGNSDRQLGIFLRMSLPKGLYEATSQEQEKATDSDFQ